MPWTAACFLVGAVAISALPPLNGFVSEWLTFQALLQTARIPRPEINLAFVLGLAGLALTGGLAAACFVKAYGITFLALPRSEAAADAKEAPWSMRVPMLALALACAALGLGAAAVLPVLGRLAAALLRAPDVRSSGSLTLAMPEGVGSVSPLIIALSLTVALAAVPLALALVRASRVTRSYETWGCGRMLQTARMEYTATAFSNPFKRVFGFLYRPVKRLEIDFHPESRFFVRTIEYRNETRSIFEDWFYAPVLAALRGAAARARALQSGSTNLYLGYILAVLLALLVLAR
jgi:hydrogenase-4 component B